MSEVKRIAQEQSAEAYIMFIKFLKWVGCGTIAFLLIIASCSFGVDGTGGKSDPSLFEEYMEKMEEMKNG